MLPDRLCVVLSHPSHPGNVGSAARAMKTMGFSDLRLVAGPALPSDEATALAAGGADVLERVRRFDSLAAALADCVLAVGFSARSRELSHRQAPVRALAEEIASA